MSNFHPKSTSSILLVLLFLFVGCGTSDEPEENPTATATSPQDPTAMPSDASPPAALEEIDKPRPAGEVPTAVPPMDSSFDADGDGFMTKDELWEALVATENQYPLPPGYSISVEQLYERQTSPHPDSTEFENGAEHSILGRVHWCAWGQTYLDAELRSDELTKDTALNQLQTVTLNVPNFYNLKDRFEEIFNAAALGDSAELRNLVEVNCTWDAFEATPSAILAPNKPNGVTIVWL